MGNYNFKPRMALDNNKPVQITGFNFSQEQVPKEIKSLGNAGYVIHTKKLYQSRSNAQPVYITRIKYPKSNKIETFLTNDLQPIRR